MHNWEEEKDFVRRGIRTPAHRSGLRPERSALDRSAILTYLYKYRREDFYTPLKFNQKDVTTICYSLFNTTVQ